MSVAVLRITKDTGHGKNAIRALKREVKWVSPCCEQPTLPPAVYPNTYRLCWRCGEHFDPTQAVAR